MAKTGGASFPRSAVPIAGECGNRTTARRNAAPENIRSQLGKKIRADAVSDFSEGQISEEGARVACARSGKPGYAGSSRVCPVHCGIRRDHRVFASGKNSGRAQASRAIAEFAEDDGGANARDR